MEEQLQTAGQKRGLLTSYGGVIIIFILSLIFAAYERMIPSLIADAGQAELILKKTFGYADLIAIVCSLLATVGAATLIKTRPGNVSTTIFIVILLGDFIIFPFLNAVPWNIAIPAILLKFACAYYAGGRGASNTGWVLFALFAGALIGKAFVEHFAWYNVFSKIFVNLIKTVVAPLIFGTLVVGIAGHSDMKAVGRMGAKAMGYFISVTLVALVIGLIAINISKAGIGIPLMDDKELIGIVAAKTPQETVIHIFPENIAKAISEGQVLQVVVFSLMFALAMSFASQESRKKFLSFAESLSEIMFKFTSIIMYLAPYAVGGAIAYTVAKLGFEVFENLAKLLLTLYVALIVLVVGVFLPIALYNKIPLRRFWKYASEPVTIALSTTSSEAALPKAMENLEKFGVSRRVVSFVYPTGLSFNLDGSTLYLSLAAVFVAQAGQTPMTVGQQITMLLTLLLTSKGVAGVSRASLVILASTVTTFHLKEWPIAAILGIDALMDMGRTAVNTLGNCLATAVVGKWEGEVDFSEKEGE